MTSGEASQLFELSLLGDPESDAAWEPVERLRKDGSRQIFDQAADWCISEDPRKRARAADILCQLRRLSNPDDPCIENPREPEWLYRDESQRLIAGMLKTECEALVLRSAIHALGHIGRPSAISTISRFHDHPDPSVRFAVACALGSLANDALAAATLLKLTGDEDAPVRDWAVFALGVLGDADSPEIRDALLRCLNDSNEDVREEAAHGLGRRRDPRLFPWLRETLAAKDLNYRVAETVSAWLGLPSDPPEWCVEDYKAALELQRECPEIP